jgi:Cenp-O kinetochore centromere component
VILKKEFEEKEQYVVHRHTIPLYVPLMHFAEMFLTRGVSGLEAFAINVHRELILLTNRRGIAESLKSLYGVEEVNVDEGVRLLEVVTRNWTAKIILLEKDVKCVAVDNEKIRLPEVERRIMDDSKVDLVERISRVI